MNKSILDKQLEIDKIQKGTSVALFYKNIDAYKTDDAVHFRRVMQK